MTKSLSWHHHQQLLLEKNPQIAMVMLCLAVACLLLSYPSAFYGFQQSLEIYCSTFVFPVFAHNLERKWCMFLLCNGILAFLAATSSFDAPLRLAYEPRHTAQSAMADSYKEESTVANSVKYPVVEEEDEVGEEAQEDDDHAEEQIREQEEGGGEEQETVSLETVGGENVEWSNGEGGAEESGGPAIAEETRERSSEGGIGMTEEAFNADELNRKCDEFIRRMKEELRFEAQWQLVAA